MSKTRIVFVHGIDAYGAAAWPRQHLLAGQYDCLFLRRTGFDAVEPPVPTDFAADARSVIQALGDAPGGGHVVAHDQGAIAAVMAAVERPDLVRSLVLVEPSLLSLTAELPATMAYREYLEPLHARAAVMGDAAFAAEFRRLSGALAGPGPAGAAPGLSGMAARAEPAARTALRLRLQAPPWEAPVHIVPGVPTLVLTGGWEPLYEEIAGYLAATGARHETAPGGHRPQDSQEGAALIAAFLADTPHPAG